MSDELYNDEVRERFARPGFAAPPDAATTARAAGQGVIVELVAQAAGDTVLTLGFRAYGCPHLIAAADHFCDTFSGRPLAELAQFDPKVLLEKLAIPVEKTGRILVLEDAARALAAELAQSTGQ